MGYSVAIYPTAALFAAAHAVARVYGSLAAGKLVDVPLYTFEEFVQLIGWQKIWDFEKKYADLLAETGRAANR
jgi:hypothetical protein